MGGSFWIAALLERNFEREQARLNSRNVDSVDSGDVMVARIAAVEDRPPDEPIHEGPHPLGLDANAGQRPADPNHRGRDGSGILAKLAGGPVERAVGRAPLRRRRRVNIAEDTLDQRSLRAGRQWALHDQCCRIGRVMLGRESAHVRESHPIQRFGLPPARVSIGMFSRERSLHQPAERLTGRAVLRTGPGLVLDDLFLECEICIIYVREWVLENAGDRRKQIRQVLLRNEREIGRRVP